MAEFEYTSPRQDPASRRRRMLLRAALGGVALAAPLASLAQPRPKMWRIGFLAADSSSTRVYEGFRQGMREHG